MLYGNHFDREENEDINLARGPESANCNASDSEENLHPNNRENRSGNSPDLGQNSTGASSSAEFNRLSCELNSRISREMDEMMNSVCVQIQSRGQLTMQLVIKYCLKSKTLLRPDRDT